MPKPLPPTETEDPPKPKTRQMQFEDLYVEAVFPRPDWTLRGKLSAKKREARARRRAEAMRRCM